MSRSLRSEERTEQTKAKPQAARRRDLVHCFVFPMTVTSFSFSQDVTRNKEKLLVTVYRSLRHAALRRSSVLLRSASLDFAKLRLGLLAILLSDDT